MKSNFKPRHKDQNVGIVNRSIIAADPAAAYADPTSAVTKSVHGDLNGSNLGLWEFCKERLAEKKVRAEAAAVMKGGSF